MSPQMTEPHLIDISLHADNSWDWGSKENIAAKKSSSQEPRDHSLAIPVRCTRNRRFLVDEERVLCHVVRVGVDIDLTKLLQLLSSLWGGVVRLWSVCVDVSYSGSSGWACKRK